MVKYFKNKFSYVVYKKYIPANYCNSDIYIVSFPKSGNTWLRFLIANAIKIHFGIQREVNFFSIQDIIPGITVSRNIEQKGPFGLSGVPRILTSHSKKNPLFNRVILLVRDPRDVMLSYYFHLKNYNSISEGLSISEFIRHKHFGIEAWKKHTNSWIKKEKFTGSERIMVYKYEDLIKNTAKLLDEILQLLGLRMNKNDLQKAIELSSKEYMRNSEQNHMSTYFVKTKKTNFVRSGLWSKGNNLNERDRLYIEKNLHETMKLMGYL